MIFSQKTRKTASLEAQGALILRLAILLVIPILLFNTVLAWDWDNVKSYDATKQEVTITNALGLGSNIAKVKLDTPLVVNVIRGKNRKVAEFTIDNYQEYNALQEMQFYNMNEESRQEMNKEFTYKYKTLKETTRPTYEIVCEDSKEINKTTDKYDSICSRRENGTQIYYIEEWNNLELEKISSLPIGKITIGIFTDVEAGDYVEWIPTFYGLRIEEWATWTESLNTKLSYYYNMSSLTNVVTPGSYDLTANAGTVTFTNVGCIIAPCAIFDGDNVVISPVQGLFDFNTHNKTFNFWFNNNGSMNKDIFGMNWAVEGYDAGFDAGGVFYPGRVDMGTAQLNNKVVQGNWMMLTISIDDTNVRWYVNGTLDSTGANPDDATFSGTRDTPFTFGSNYGNTKNIIAIVDEMGVWNRSLSASEISNLWNGGAGITYQSEFPDAPVLNVTFPIATNYTTNLLHLNYTVSDTGSNLNTCWYSKDKGVTNTTITCGQNVSSLTATKGLNTWTVWANDTKGDKGSSSVIFNIDSHIPTINVTYPLWTNYTTNNLDLKYTLNDTGNNINTCWYSKDSGATNVTITCGTNATGLIANLGLNTWTVWVNDTYGDTAYSNVTFNVDTHNPAISITYPQETNYSISPKDLNYTIGDAGADLGTCKYTTNNWATNNSLTCGNNVTGLTATEGSNIWGIWANDSMGFSSLSSVTFTLHTIPPTISIQAPTEDEILYNYTDEMILVLNELGDSCLYSLDGSANVTLNKHNSTYFNKTINYVTKSSHRVDVSCNDTIGNFGFNNINISIDLVAPSLSITYPSNATQYTFNADVGESYNVTVNYTASDTNIQACRFNNGTSTRTITCGENASEGYGSGWHTVYYYVNDTVNNTNQSYVSFYINKYNFTLGYDNALPEQTNHTISFNVTADSITSSYANVSYNGVNYQMTNNFANTTRYEFTRIITGPAVASDSLINFSIVYYLNGNKYETGNYTQTVYHVSSPIISYNCVNPVINFDWKDEKNFTNLNGTIKYNFRYGNSVNDSIAQSYGEITDTHFFKLCVNYTASDSWILGYGEIQYSTGNYADNRYYLFKDRQLINGTTSNITIYSLSTSLATNFLFTIQDNQYDVSTNTFLALLRWYPDLDSYLTTEMGKADDKGQTPVYLEATNADYRYAIYSLNGTLVKLFSPVRFVCTSTPCTYNVFLPTSSGNYYSTDRIVQGLSYNRTSKVFKYTWNDADSLTTSMNLTVFRDAYDTSTIICSNISTGAIGTMTCYVGATTGTIRAVAYRSSSPLTPIASLIVSIGTQLSEMTGGKTIGLLMSFILFTFAFLVGIFNPVVALFLGGMALIPALYFGSITVTLFVGVILLAWLIIHFARKS